MDGARTPLTDGSAGMVVVFVAVCENLAMYGSHCVGARGGVEEEEKGCHSAILVRFS